MTWRYEILVIKREQKNGGSAKAYPVFIDGVSDQLESLVLLSFQMG
jgi:hypothetical protein